MRPTARRSIVAGRIGAGAGSEPEQPVADRGHGGAHREVVHRVIDVVEEQSQSRTERCGRADRRLDGLGDEGQPAGGEASRTTSGATYTMRYRNLLSVDAGSVMRLVGVQQVKLAG